MTSGAGGRRFAIVAPNFHPRICGIGDHSVRLGAELRRRGHDVVFFSRQPVERHPEAPELEAHGIAGSHPLAIAQGVAAAIAERRPSDVLLQYTPRMWDAWRFGSLAPALVASRAREVGAKVTLIAHEPFVPWYQRPDLMLAAFMQRAHFAALLGNCDHVFVTTETRLRYVDPYRRALRLAPARVTRVGANALPIARPVRPEMGARTGDGPRIGVFSTAAVGKRFDVVLDAFAGVAREHPAASLVLIGDLGPANRPAVREIKAAIRSHPAGERIRMTGRLSLPHIADEVAMLDIYLFPMDTGANTRTCTLPVALGSGLPVVAVVGIETDLNLFRDGENIVMARELGGGAFAEAALRILRDQTLAGRVAEGARRLYQDHLSWVRIADELLAVI